MKTLEGRIKEQAHILGFELVGIAPATSADGFERMREWLNQGYAGEMSYMHRQAEARRHPDSILAEVRSVIMVGMNYKPAASGQWPVASKEMAAERADESELTWPTAAEISSLATSHWPLATAQVARYA